jgi:hypothetical protein
LRQKSGVEHSLMRFAVFSDKSRTVDSKYYMKLLKRDIVDKHVICALKECRIDGANRQHALSGHSSGHRYGVLFSNADVEKSTGIMLREKIEACRALHCRGNCAELRIVSGEFGKLSSKHG